MPPTSRTVGAVVSRDGVLGSVEHFTQHDPLFVPPEAPAVTGKWLAERRSERAVIATRELYTGLEWYRIGDALNIHVRGK